MEWTVKYAPKSMADLVGNKSNYLKLHTWLKKYYLTKVSARTKDFKLIALLVGPPGIGKTSGIIALSKELKYEIIEFNASDQRNEKIISRLVGRETKTQVNQGYKGKIVLLDEVDGIQGREDRGGLKALMKLAKESVHPIICTANDPQSDKIRSLKNSPMTIPLNFNIPSNEEMVTLLQNISEKEGITVSDKLLTVICNNAHGDIRGAVNDLENLSQERKEIPMNAIQALSIRDSEISIGLALEQIFGRAKTLRQAREVTSDLDVDYDMFKQYIMENIPYHSIYPTELMSMFSNAALADLFYGRIMQSQHWKYLKYYLFFLSAGILASKESPPKLVKARFPSNIMMLSRTKKVRSIKKSVTRKFGRMNHCSQNKITNYSLPYIRLTFEKLFELYASKKIDSEPGQNLLYTVSEIQNEIALEQEEFIYLFNDPLYEKQTAAEEKKQVALIKLIDEKALEIRKDKIVSHNKQINQLLTFQQPEISGTAATPIASSNQKTKLGNQIITDESSSSSSILASTAAESKQASSQTLDTFDLEEKNVKSSKRTRSPASQKRVSKKSVREQSKEEDLSKQSTDSSKDRKEKGKQKGLLEFTSPKKGQTKKKKDSKNLTDFL